MIHKVDFKTNFYHTDFMLRIFSLNKFWLLNSVDFDLKKMVASNLGADASSRQYDDVEGRLSLQEVPDKISRIFFGDPQKQYQQGRGYI